MNCKEFPFTFVKEYFFVAFSCSIEVLISVVYNNSILLVYTKKNVCKAM